MQKYNAPAIKNVRIALRHLDSCVNVYAVSMAHVDHYHFHIREAIIIPATVCAETVGTVANAACNGADKPVALLIRQYLFYDRSHDKCHNSFYQKGRHYPKPESSQQI